MLPLKKILKIDYSIRSDKPQKGKKGREKEPFLSFFASWRVTSTIGLKKILDLAEDVGFLLVLVLCYIFVTFAVFHRLFIISEAFIREHADVAP